MRNSLNEPSQSPEASADAIPAADSDGAIEQFVHLWGQMASNWGINRTMAQIHALLYASEAPLNADDIMERLDVSRGNASMNLRALMEWNLIWRSHQDGSRKDYYQAEKDVWKITATIIEERQKREIKPVRDALQGVAGAIRSSDERSQDEAAFAERIDALVSFLAVFEGFSGALLPLLRGRGAKQVQRIVRYASTIRSKNTPPKKDD